MPSFMYTAFKRINQQIARADTDQPTKYGQRVRLIELFNYIIQSELKLARSLAKLECQYHSRKKLTCSIELHALLDEYDYLVHAVPGDLRELVIQHGNYILTSGIPHSI